MGRDGSCLLTCHHLEGGEVDVVLGHLLEQLVWGESGQGGCGQPQYRAEGPTTSRGMAKGGGLLTYALTRLTGGLEEISLDL